MTVPHQSQQVSSLVAHEMTKFPAAARNHCQEGETRARVMVLYVVDLSLNCIARAALARAFWRLVRVLRVANFLMKEG